MKPLRQLTIVSLVVFSFIAISSCSSTDAQNEITKSIAPENIVAVDYAVDGMVCAMGCAGAIQKEVGAMNGVADCKVDFEGKKAHIEFDKTLLTEEEIIAKIEGVAKDQYKVSEWTEESSEEPESGDSADDEVIGEVSLTNFEIPNLFTLLFEQF